LEKKQVRKNRTYRKSVHSSWIPGMILHLHPRHGGPEPVSGSQ
jgi:hypothetical protein